MAALLAVLPARTRAQDSKVPIINGVVEPALPMQEGAPEPVPPQEGGEETPAPPQEGGEETPAPPQEGGEETPTPPQEGGEESPAPPQEGGEEPPTPPQEGGEAPPAPPPEGKEPPPAEGKKPAPVPPAEGEKPAPPKKGGEPPPAEGKKPPPAPPAQAPKPAPAPKAPAPEPPPPPQEGGEPVLPPQEGGDPGLPPQEAGEPALPPLEAGEPPVPLQEEGAAPSQESGDPAVAPQEIGEPGLPIQEGGEPTLPLPQPEEPAKPLPVEAAPVPAPAPRAPEVINELAPELPFVMEAPFSLSVNQVEKGEIIVVLKDDDVFVRREDLEAAGIGELKGGREETFFDRPMLSLKSVSPPLSYELDERDIALRIVAPVELLPRQFLNMSGVRGDVTYQNKTSGFLNYGARLSDFDILDVYQEVGASHDGNLAFSSMYLSTDREPIRGLTSFTINERETRRRLVFGDALVQTGTLGSSYITGGFTLSRTFDLDPYAVRSPRIGYSGSTLTPANVEVYVNGALIRTEPIQPGSFELNNLQVAGGRGLATYVIRDVFGQEQRISIPFYISGSVLAKGFEEFTYSLGALRERVGSESWGYDRVAFVGTHRRGITDRLTLGGRAEATDRLITGGPSLTTLTPIGQIELELAASHELNEGTGLATFLSYSFLSRYFSAGAFGRLVSDRYSTLNIGAGMDKITRSAGFYQSTPIGKRISVTSRAQITRNRDSGMSWQVGSSFGARIIYQLNASLSAGYARSDRLQEGQWDVLAGISYVFGQQYFASVQTRMEGGARGENAALDLTANRSLPIGEGYGFRASSTFDEISTGNMTAQYQTVFGRYSAGYSVTGYGDDIPLEHHYTLDAAGGIAVVPGVGLFATLPVSDGFGVIRVRGVKGVRGYISNKEIGRTDRNGNLVVPNLLSYYGNSMRIDPEDVPMRYTLDVTELTIAPPQRGVAVAEFEVTTPHYYRGLVTVDERGKTVVPQFGQIRVQGADDTEIISPLGPHGEFDLEGVTPGSHKAFIDYTGGTCEMPLEAPDSDSPVIELGELKCVQ